jgi:hypothetical protein
MNAKIDGVNYPHAQAAAQELTRKPVDSHGFARVAHFHVASVDWHCVEATVLATIIAEIAKETEKNVAWMRTLESGMDVEVTTNTCNVDVWMRAKGVQAALHYSEARL